MHVQAWETIEHHQAVIADKQQYPVVMAALGKACKEMVFLYHAKFSGDLYKTLNAPLTKFAIWTVKESADRARFHEALSQLVAKTPSNESEGISAGGLGEVIEDQRKFFASLGWQSMDVSLHCVVAVLAAHILSTQQHFNAVVAAAPQVAEQHDALKKLGADVEYKFVKFTKYSA